MCVQGLVTSLRTYMQFLASFTQKFIASFACPSSTFITCIAEKQGELDTRAATTWLNFMS